MKKKESNSNSFDTQLLKETLLSQIDKYDSSDPRSIRYIRKFNRPEINWFRITMSLFSFFGLLVLVFVFGKKIYGVFFAFALVIMALVITLLLFGKIVAIVLIKIYQRYAPLEIRKRCMFEPSCSDYAIIALQKYGFVKALRLIINRLKRCNPNGGGFDYLK